MMPHRLHPRLCLVAALGGLLASGCGDAPASPCGGPVALAVSPRELLLLGMPSEAALGATAIGAGHPRVAWQTSDARVVTIDSTTPDGRTVFVRGLSIGVVRLTAMPADCPGTGDEATITVTAIPADPREPGPGTRREPAS